MKILKINFVSRTFRNDPQKKKKKIAKGRKADKTATVEQDMGV